MQEDSCKAAQDIRFIQFDANKEEQLDKQQADVDAAIDDGPGRLQNTIQVADFIT